MVHGILTTSKNTVTVFLAIDGCIFVIYLIKAGWTNDSKTVFLSAHINILPNSQSLKSNCQIHSHCTFASCKTGSTPTNIKLSKHCKQTLDHGYWKEI